MRIKLIRCFCISLTMVILLSAITISACGYNIYTYESYTYCNNVSLVHNNNQVYLVATKENFAYIEAIYPETFNITLTLNNNAQSYNLFNDKLVIICPCKEYNQSEVVLYDISYNNFKSFNIPDISVNDGCKIAYTNGSLYYIDADGNIVQFTDNGKYVQKFTFESDINSLMTDFNGDLYATSLYGLYKFNQNSFSCICGESFYQQSRFIGNNTLINGNGYIYNVSGNKVSKQSSFKGYSEYPSGGIYNGYIIAPETNTVFAIDKNNYSKMKSITLADNIVQVCVVSDMIVVLTHSNNKPTVSLIPFSAFKDVAVNNSNTENNIGCTNGISSNTYIVNNSSYKITDIANSTTVSKFKNNMNYQGYNVEFYKSDGKSFTSGNVTTDTSVKFYNGISTYEYKLSVTGDLTGEGNVNSKDKKKMFDYLLGDSTLEGVYIDSANLDKNNRISVADLVLLMRLIKSNEN